WKGGKADNLRALLGSLDNVLWEGSGWKKISMADLVLPAKVKVQYMKGIAKVHPDKIPTDATTEQRMIAGAVFSALNEAWDKFKAENGL
ncbi:auxilin-like clathrin-binding protein required for normal clathrin function, partial [Exophiala xenobiotica]